MTSPANTQNLQPDQQQNEEQQQRYNPKLYWQRQEQTRQTQRTDQNQRDTIDPAASQIDLGGIYNRMQPIAHIGAQAAAGQIISSAQQKQMQEQIAAKKAADAQMRAQNAAIANIQKYQQYLGKIDYKNITIPGSSITIPGSAGGGANYGNQTVQWDRSDAALADMMRKAGFPDSAIPVGLGVAHAESSLDENATHMNSTGNYVGTIDQGVFQINTMHKNEPWYPKNPFDPQQSVNAAFALWQRAGGKWTDWTTYNQGLANARALPASRLQPFYTTNTGGTTITTGNGQLRMVAVQKAQAYVDSGVGYVWGGDNLQTGVDCSGLVQQVYKQLGLNLPRTAYEQSMYGTKAPINSLRPGDLVAWYGDNGNGNPVGHIAIYAGNGQILESYDTGKPARRRNLTQTEIGGGGSAFGVKIRFPNE